MKESHDGNKMDGHNAEGDDEGHAMHDELSSDE